MMGKLIISNLECINSVKNYLIRNILYGNDCMYNTAKMRLISLLICHIQYVDFNSPVPVARDDEHTLHLGTLRERTHTREMAVETHGSFGAQLTGVFHVLITDLYSKLQLKASG